MFKILLLEDDEILANTLEELLIENSFILSRARDAKEAIDISYDNSFDLLLLDVNVPYMSGFDFLKELRQSGDKTPAFFITALKDIESITQGFKVGGDDYIKKPFDFDELLVRINAKLKIDDSIIYYDDISYNIDSDTVYKENREVHMAYTDKKILFMLLKDSGKIVIKERIFEIMEKPTDLALRVHISKIKKLLGLEIQNIRGLGYKLEKI